MKKVKLRILFILLLITIASCDNSLEPYEPNSFLDKKIGQMLITGFNGYNINGNENLIKNLRDGIIGGVIIYERNIQSPDQLKLLISSLQNESEIPLFISIDHEGGKVNRLKSKYGFPSTVSQQYLGTMNNPDSTEFYSLSMASTLKEMGFNLNFAPVVDVNINPQSPAIGKVERSFSADPQIVIDNSRIVIDAYHKFGIYTTLKHFPGHGSASDDSHSGLTDITNTWQQLELKPYEELIKTGYNDFVMTAHVFNFKLDPDNPATLSNKIVTGNLRNELGFKGIVISDDLGMEAITSAYGLKESIEKAINAGVDILLFSHNLINDKMFVSRVISIVRSLINEGKVSEERIDESYNKIMDYKNLMMDN